MSELARTPLYEAHIELGGRMVPFAGFEMPVQYKAGALQEYKVVREGGAGLFDISHMGQVRVTGPEAIDFLQYVTTNDVSRLADGQVQYSALLNDQGTFIDDITTYRMGETEFYLCINAANRHKDVAHLEAQAARFDVTVSDESDDTTLLALQGETAQALLQPLADIDLESVGYYRFATAVICSAQAIVSRTGYTGEDGFELYLSNDAAGDVWNSLIGAGAQPIGLAARDMLRTEMGYALYGHEISDAVTPVEAKLMWITKLEKGDFIGRDAVAARKAEGGSRQLVALKLTGRGIPREHYGVLAGGERIGEITSGMHSPLLGCGVALAYVPTAHAIGSVDGDELAVEIRSRAVACERVKTPFVRSRVRK
ncbi:MAG TPA: glycine cleavage system aminomethyltransferase GcvT [Mariprofundaceae bacterium]|nr:glycine cleavage system aminomethyltransferase GcvT [Mariprofundaceae bacterium]